MSVHGAAGGQSRPISIDGSFSRCHSVREIASERQKSVGSVAFEVLKSGDAFRLLGPEMSYHRADPYLTAKKGVFRNDMSSEDLLAFTSSDENRDLCCEDSWTGFFLATYFSRHALPSELVLIHLDDHADMMPSLLECSALQLYDPTSGKPFDPRSGDDWKSAIYSGAINIGNYLTPWFFTDSRLHIRHLRNQPCTNESCKIYRDARGYDLLPDLKFASLCRATIGDSDPEGEYISNFDPAILLQSLPRTCTIVHIDLDYFINDFNGACRGDDYVPAPELHGVAISKMDRFFSELSAQSVAVDRWIIATSPGFCSAYHWRFLLEELETRIRQLSPFPQ
jgi:hypothetical protein